jgi:hypothetical protein
VLAERRDVTDKSGYGAAFAAPSTYDPDEFFDALVWFMTTLGELGEDFALTCCQLLAHCSG